MTHPFIRAAVAAASLAASTGLATAHVTFEGREVAPASTQRFVLRVPHGCDGQPTRTLRVTIPEGVVQVKPMPKAGWTLTATPAPLTRPSKVGSAMITEGVRELVWSGGDLPDGFYDEFVFRARIADDVAPGTRLFFPAVQDCPAGQAAWTQLPAEGQDPHSLKMPAPMVRLAQSQPQPRAEAPAHATPVYRAGSLRIEQPWARATPTGARVAGGYLRITNEGKTADRLIGGSFPLAGRVEIHEMTMIGGIMRMRPLDPGLDIAPGASVELKPGGYHIMFMDLKDGLKAGQSVTGTLVFEKAGTVEVTFTIAPIGAQTPGAPAGGHSHH
jgi:uncharacterized protein YcnI/copper(I)-binding protein